VRRLGLRLSLARGGKSRGVAWREKNRVSGRRKHGRQRGGTRRAFGCALEKKEKTSDAMLRGTEGKEWKEEGQERTVEKLYAHLVHKDRRLVALLGENRSGVKGEKGKARFKFAGLILPIAIKGPLERISIAAFRGKEVHIFFRGNRDLRKGSFKRGGESRELC